MTTSAEMRAYMEAREAKRPRDMTRRMIVMGGGSRAKFDPASLGNLAAWFRFNTGVTIDSSNRVSQWADASGNGRHLKQATDNNKPIVQADGSILFDGVSDFLKCDAFTLDQPISIYILGKQVTWTLNDRWSDGNTAGSVTIFQSGTTPTLGVFAGTSVTTTLALDTYAVVSGVVNGASSSIQINNNTAVTGNAGANNAAGFTLGASPTPANWGNIQVKEVILFAAAHDAATRASVISYLLGGNG